MSRTVYRDGIKLTETEDAVHRRKQRELYDIDTDPAERSNLLEAKSPLDADDASELQALLAEFGVEVRRAAVEAVRVDRSTQERLRALGY